VQQFCFNADFFNPVLHQLVLRVYTVFDPWFYFERFDFLSVKCLLQRCDPRRHLLDAS